MELLYEDLGYFDLTTLGLGISNKKGVMRFVSKGEIILSGADEVKKVFKELDLYYKFFKQNGETIGSNEIIAECKADAAKLHKAWKISQNTFEYMSAIATYTNKLLSIARSINPTVVVATTRKNFPNTKELMLKAVIDGGGVPHRLGLYDSILIFKQHLVFLNSTDELEKQFKKLKTNFCEKKIIVEVENYEEASYFADLGADILQCEKMTYEVLAKCTTLKTKYPALLLSATGGINEKNIADFVKCGVDFVVTSSPYHAKPVDIKVEITEEN